MDPYSCNYDGDNGGVHTNGNILNKAAYLIFNGGQHNGYTILPPSDPHGTMGWKAIWFYWGLLHNAGLTSNTTFGQLRDAAVTLAWAVAKNPQSGFDMWEACAVQNAFASVGLGSGDGDCNGVDDDLAQDSDHDTFPDSKDNCPNVANPGQQSNDGDPWGDDCDPDDDGWADDADTCHFTYNPGQQDTVHPNGVGDACDNPDQDDVVDHDWETGVLDNCPDLSNSDQLNHDGDQAGDVCDDNDDGDAVPDAADNCPLTDNQDQSNVDGDGSGDLCDNCVNTPNSDQAASDQDGLGNACDLDDDDDGICDAGGPLPPGSAGTPSGGCKRGPFGTDNCPQTWNPSQFDGDHNGNGYDCDSEEQQKIQDSIVDQLKDKAQTAPVQVLLPQPHPDPLAVHPDYLPNGFEYSVDIGLTDLFEARVVDSTGMVVAHTLSGQRDLFQQSLTFEPVPSFVEQGMAPLLAAPGSDPPAADGMHYYLEIIPIGGWIPTTTYTLTLEAHAGMLATVYLPLVMRQH